VFFTMAVIVWITTIISAVIILIAGHIAITIVLPKLKELVNPVIKDEKSLSALMTLLLILIIVLALGSIITVLNGLQNDVVNLLNVFKPGLTLLTDFGNYVGYIILGFIVVLGLKYFK